jgi:hypothetical protein
VRWLGRSRRYSPLNRAHGLRRLPDDLLGLAFVASLLLHVALVGSLVRLTDALPETPAGEDVTTILADLTAGTPAGPPAPVHAAPPARSGKGPAAVDPPATKTKPSPPAASPRPGADVPTTPQPPAPAASGIDPGAGPVALPSLPPVEPAGPDQDGPTLVSTVSAAPEAREVSAPLAFDIDTPLDAGWPEPPPSTGASPPRAPPAPTLPVH